MSAGYKWKRLQRAIAKPAGETLIRAWMEHNPNKTREQVLAMMDQEMREVELWRNDLYQVEVRRYDNVGWVHLNIRRLDGFPGRDWRHFQQIKNELVGPECEGIELYPAESRLTDTGNKYHLYICTDPAYRVPFGFQKRDVMYGDDTLPGLRQRPPMQFAETS